MTDVFTWPVGRAAEEEAGFPSERAPARWTAVYVAAATTGGAATGAIVAAGAGLARAEAPDVFSVIAVTAVGVAALSLWLELRGAVRPLPQRRGQVPRHWLGWRHRTMTAGAFGLMIGSGALTFLEHAIAYVLIVVIVLSSAPLLGGIIGGIYGATRGLTLLASWIAAGLGRHIAWERLADSETAVRRLLVLSGAVSIAVALVASLAGTG